MRSVFICHSAADQALVQELVEFLRRGANVQVFQAEGTLRTPEELPAKLREGMMADTELLVLSPHSAPARWRREEWMPALWDEPEKAGVAVAVLLAGQCRVPDLLRRKNFFDLTGERTAGFRAVKAWLLGLEAPSAGPVFTPAPLRRFTGREAELEALRRRLADQTGCALLRGPLSGCGKTALGLAFAALARRDFEAVFWLDCGGRSLAGVAGDLAAQVGLRLEGPAEENCAKLRRFCAERRFLVVLDGLEDDRHLELVPGGWSSTLIATRRELLHAGQELELSLEEVFPTPDLAGLDEFQGRLLSAMAACAPGCSLRLAAAVAGLEPASAQRAAAALVECGAILMLNEQEPSFTMAARVREAVRKPEALRRHAELISRGEEARLADIEQALPWALACPGPEDWSLACSLAWLGFRKATAAGRIAEACQFLCAAFETAERRGDARSAGEFARELSWICHGWGWEQEAVRYHWRTRMAAGGQLTLPF